MNINWKCTRLKLTKLCSRTPHLNELKRWTNMETQITPVGLAPFRHFHFRATHEKESFAHISCNYRTNLQHEIFAFNWKIEHYHPQKNWNFVCNYSLISSIVSCFNFTLFSSTNCGNIVAIVEWKQSRSSQRLLIAIGTVEKWELLTG